MQDIQPPLAAGHRNRVACWKRTFWQHLPSLLAVALVVLIINVRHLNEPPAYIHAWAQADNYSLALGFLHNGGDLLHPQTMIYNKQQMDFTSEPSLVTACDLPLHHWLAAGLMAFTGHRAPWVFRGLTLSVSVLGLWALYLLVVLLTRSRLKALLVASVAATAPSFAYYSASFLPTAPALALALGGLLAYALHVRKDNTVALYISLLLLTLALLTRTSMAVLWVAVASFHVLRLLRGEAILRRTWLPFVFGAVLFVAWQMWNMHLRQRYGSLFLGSLLPVKDWDEAVNVYHNVHDRWRFHYFLRSQHWLYVLVAVVGLAFCIIRRRRTPQAGQRSLSLWWLLAIWLFGEMLFAFVMLRQFSDHDYYFLDSFFLPLMLLLAGLLTLVPVPQERWLRWGLTAVVLLFIVSMTVQSCDMQRVRRQEGVESLQTAVRYKQANRMLDKAGFGSRQLCFLTLFAYPQNTPFDMMDREGYAVMWNDTAVVRHALTFDYDYILVEDEVYRRKFDDAAYILPRLRRLAGDGELSVCVLSDSVLHADADHFFTTAARK